MGKTLLSTSVAAIVFAIPTAWAEENDVFKNLQISGLLELEANFVAPESGEDESDFRVASAEITLAAPVHEWVKAELVLLYEQDETDFGVDSASVTVAPPEGPWFMRGGLFVQPFGRFDTNLVSEPLTLELAETVETALQFGWENNGFSASAYVFNGDGNRVGASKIDPSASSGHRNFGVDIGYAIKSESMALNLAAGYIHHIGDSDALQDAIANLVADAVPGGFLSANASFGPVTLIGEYTAAGDAFQAGELDWNGVGAQPRAWNLEVAYGFTLAGKESHVALGYQGTREALALGLPASRVLAALAVEVMKGTTLAIEGVRDEDYSVTEGGSGESSNSMTVQLALEF